eukprot:11223787-Lingulodinium_polyedra.AAC.1
MPLGLDLLHESGADHVRLGGGNASNHVVHQLSDGIHQALGSLANHLVELGLCHGLQQLGGVLHGDWAILCGQAVQQPLLDKLLTS